jgi:hypothetical protein
MKLKLAIQGIGLAVLALAGCAKAPTEILVTVSVDPAVVLPITSLTVTVTDAKGGLLGGGSFAALALAPADAEAASFYFPVQLQVGLPGNVATGDVGILIEGSDPTTDGVVIARGMGAGSVAPQTTMQGTVTLLAVAPPEVDGGVPDASGDAEPDMTVAP